MKDLRDLTDKTIHDDDGLQLFSSVRLKMRSPINTFRRRCGEASRGEKMLSSGTDPESYTTDYT